MAPAPPQRARGGRRGDAAAAVSAGLVRDTGRGWRREGRRPRRGKRRRAEGQPVGGSPGGRVGVSGGIGLSVHGGARS